MSAEEGESHAMISALLHLLGQHEMSPGKPMPKTAPKPAEPVLVETFAASFGAAFHEVNSARFNAAAARFAPVDPESSPVQIRRSQEVRSYLEAVDRLTSAPDSHALDIFE